MPLSVCLLTLLTLADRFSPNLLWPQIDPRLKTLVGLPAVYEGVLEGPPRLSKTGLKFVVKDLRREGQSLSGKVLLTAADPPAVRLERGDRVRFSVRLKRPTRYKNPGSFDYRRPLQRQGILLTGFLDESRDLQLIEKRGGIFRPFDRFRERVLRLIRESLSGDEAGLMAALLLGDVSGLSEKTQSDFQATGTSHLVAVSGQHISIIAAVAVAVLLRLIKRSERILLLGSARSLAVGLSLLPVMGYTLLAGAPPSAVRAATLAGLIALAVLLRRQPDGASALAAAALVITFLNPSAPFSASFQLSFLAVAGILMFRSHGRGAPTFIRRYIVNPFWITVGATLMTAPLVAYRFHEVSLSGLWVNLLAVPVAGTLLVAGLGAVLLSLLLPGVGACLIRGSGLLAGAFLQGLQGVAEWSRGWDLVVSFYPTEWEMVLGFAAVAVLFWFRRNPDQFQFWRHPAPAFAGGLLLTVLLLSSSFHWPRSDVEIVFLDVGQGDAALVLTPSGHSLLVDGGGFLIRPNRFDVGREVIVPYLKRRGLKSLDAVLLSHPHPDHFGGLRAVVEAFPIGEFWWTSQRFPDTSFDELVETIRKKGVPLKTLRAGESFPWGGGRMEVVYPERIDPVRSINDNSLVVRMVWGEGDSASVLFAGDIEKEGERTLADCVPIKAAIVKIPHHASRTSSSVPFIDSVKPFAAVASLGEDNLFGFPHEGVLEKYERRGVRVYRTDLDGAVTVRLYPGPPRKSPSIQTFSSGE